MNFIRKLQSYFFKAKTEALPIVIIKKNAGDSNVKEYASIEEAIANLEKDPNVPPEKIEQLRESLKNLKNKISIKIGYEL